MRFSVKEKAMAVGREKKANGVALYTFMLLPVRKNQSFTVLGDDKFYNICKEGTFVNVEVDIRVENKRFELKDGSTEFVEAARLNLRSVSPAGEVDGDKA